MDPFDISRIVSKVTEQITDAEQATETPATEPVSRGLDLGEMLETPKESSLTKSFLAADFSSDIFAAGQAQGTGDVQNAGPGVMWQDVEDRINSMLARLQTMNTPEARKLYQDVLQFRNQIQDMRSNPFSFFPNEDTVNRLEMLENQTIDATKWPEGYTPPPSDSTAAPVATSDGGFVDSTAGAQSASQVIYSPTPDSWPDVEDRIKSMEAKLKAMNTPESLKLLSEVMDFERQVQDAESNPFSFFPNEDIVNRLQVLERQTIYTTTLPPPQT